MAKSGDRVKIVSKEKTYEGILMPSDERIVVVKLSSGYNVGVDRTKVSDIKVLSSAPEEETRAAKYQPNPDLPTIALLHTGGTIASKVDYATGAVIPRFDPEEILSMYPELRDIANIESQLLSNILSENMTFEHIMKIAKAVVDVHTKNPKLKGIIVTHGTDTLGYTPAALQFMLKGIQIPVLVVGAQRSSDRGSSDASMNLICACEFIKQTDFKGVAICMHHTTDDQECAILPPTKTRKLHSSRRDAFRAINEKPYALVDFRNKTISWIRTPEKQGPFDPKLKLDSKVGIVKAYPGMNPKLFEAFKGYNGLVIEGTGLGHAPVMIVDEFSKANKSIRDAIKALVDGGTLVVMSNQTIYGSVQMNVYSCGIELLDLGVVPAKMLSETAFMKLSWLFGNFGKKQVPELFAQNIAGEVYDRIEDDTFLI